MKIINVVPHVQSRKSKGAEASKILIMCCLSVVAAVTFPVADAYAKPKCTTSQRISYSNYSSQIFSQEKNIKTFQKELNTLEQDIKDQATLGKGGDFDTLAKRKQASSLQVKIKKARQTISQMKSKRTAISTVCDTASNSKSGQINCTMTDLAALANIKAEVLAVQIKVKDYYQLRYEVNRDARNYSNWEEMIIQYSAALEESRWLEAELIDKFTFASMGCKNSNISAPVAINLSDLDPDQPRNNGAPLAILNDISYWINAEYGGTVIEHKDRKLVVSCKEGWAKKGVFKFANNISNATYFVVPVTGGDVQLLGTLGMQSLSPKLLKTKLETIPFGVKGWKFPFKMIGKYIKPEVQTKSLCDSVSIPIGIATETIASDIKAAMVVMSLNGTNYFLGGSDLSGNGAFSGNKIPVLKIEHFEEERTLVCGLQNRGEFDWSSTEITHFEITDPRSLNLSSTTGDKLPQVINSFNRSLTLLDFEKAKYFNQQLICRITLSTADGLRTGEIMKIIGP